jgi:hypothetical protein
MSRPELIADGMEHARGKNVISLAPDADGVSVGGDRMATLQAEAAMHAIAEMQAKLRLKTGFAFSHLEIATFRREMHMPLNRQTWVLSSAHGSTE